MKEHPILFNTEMIKAILDGRKTQTRRVLKKQPPENLTRHCWYSAPVYGFTDEPQPAENFWKINCPFGFVGDRLWVRETFCMGRIDEDDNPFASYPKSLYVDNYEGEDAYPIYKQMVIDERIDHEDVIWTPSIHMPRSASRILLEITNIRVEQLNQISRADAAKEGLHQLPATGRYVINKGDQYFGGASSNPCEVFKWLWQDIYGEDSWSKNPWVWVVEFEVIQGLNK